MVAAVAFNETSLFADSAGCELDLLWQTERYKRITQGLVPNLGMAACGDNKVLLPIHAISHRSCMASCWKLRFQSFFPVSTSKARI